MALPAAMPLADAKTPTPSPELSAMLWADSSVQYWSNPNDVSGLVYDGHSLWAATYAGVVRWDAAGTPQLYAALDGLLSQAIRGICMDGDGHIWVGYADHPGWSEYDGAAWHSYQEREEAIESRREAMLEADSFDPRLWHRGAETDWLWLPTFDGRVKAYDGTRWRTYNEQSGVTRDTWLVAVAPDGRVWAVGQGVSMAEEDERVWDDHTLFSAISENHRITDLAVDEGGAWLAYEGARDLEGGVTRLDWDQGRWRGYLHELNPSIPRQIHAVDIDAQGTLWLCGQDGLAFRRKSRPWAVVALPGSEVQCFVRDGLGEIWLGTRGGIWAADVDGGTPDGPWRVPSPLVGSEILAFDYGVDGRLFLGTPGGASYVGGTGQTGVLIREAVLALAASANGEVWAGTTNGTYRLVGDALSLAFDRPAIIIAFDGSGVPWICGQDGGLYRLGDSSPELVANLVELAGAMPHNMVFDSEGTLWFSTALGLGILSPDGAFHLATVDDGLLSPDVRAVALGPEDTLWMATAKGLARRLPSGRWTRFTTESTEGGLRSMSMWDVNPEPDGTLWMATGAGISRRTTKAVWSYYDLPGARHVLPDPAGAAWVGTPGGLYRVRLDALIPVP